MRYSAVICCLSDASDLKKALTVFRALQEQLKATEKICDPLGLGSGIQSTDLAAVRCFAPSMLGSPGRGLSRRFHSRKQRKKSTQSYLRVTSVSARPRTRRGVKCLACTRIRTPCANETFHVYVAHSRASNGSWLHSSQERQGEK